MRKVFSRKNLIIILDLAEWAVIGHVQSIMIIIIVKVIFDITKSFNIIKNINILDLFLHFFIVEFKIFDNEVKSPIIIDLELDLGKNLQPLIKQLKSLDLLVFSTFLLLQPFEWLYFPLLDMREPLMYDVLDLRVWQFVSEIFHLFLYAKQRFHEKNENQTAFELLQGIFLLFPFFYQFLHQTK